MFLKGKEILSYSYMYRNNEATYKMLIYELFAIASPDLSGLAIFRDCFVACGSSQRQEGMEIAEPVPSVSEEPCSSQ